MAKFRKKMLVQSKLEHCLVIGSYLELQISDLVLLYMDGKVRHRPTTFMRSPRFNKAFFKSKLQQQRRSLNLSCSPDTVQCSAHISSSRSPNDINFLPWKDETITQNFHDCRGGKFLYKLQYLFYFLFLLFLYLTLFILFCFFYFLLPFILFLHVYENLVTYIK